MLWSHRSDTYPRGRGWTRIEAPARARVHSRFCAAILLLAAVAPAETLPDFAPSVRSLFPLGGRRGESVDVEITGRHLDAAQELAFARPDIRAEILSSDFFSLKARITVGPNVPAANHDYRVRTPTGTYVGVFHVGSLPTVREAEPNNDPSHAQKIELPALIDARIQGEDDYDVFRFHAEAATTVIFDLLATRAASRLDGALAVLDERGNELDFIDDSYIHKDAFLAFTPKHGGDYFVRVSGTQGSYRLAAGVVPHMRRALPAAAQRGATGEFQVAGFNLHGVDRLVLGESLAEGKVVASRSDSLTFRMAVPASVEPGRYLLHAFAGSVEAPVPILMLVSDLSEQLAAPAWSRSKPQPIPLPAALTGILDRRKGSHFYSFEANAGDRIEFDVDGMKLGYLLDPVLGIYTQEGQLLAWADDRLQQNGSEPPNLDPYLVHVFEKNGTYVLMIRDSAERGDPNYVYRLAVRRVEPDFELKALTPAQTWFRGKTGLLPVRVRRQGGWATPVEVWAENLPAGVTVEKVVAEPKDTIVKDNCALDRRLDGTNVLLPFRVSADASLGAHPIHLIARGTMDGKTVEHTAEILYKWESVGKVTGPIAEQELLATVTDLPPVVLDPPERLTLTAGKPARLRVLVSRFDGGQTPLTFEADPPLPGVELQNKVMQPNANQIELRVTASGAVKPGRFRLRAGTAVSPPIEVKVAGAKSEDAEENRP